jgi:arabinan endo-1,5-alpha-L-arabinosidase
MVNFGSNDTSNRGVNIFGAYGEWGQQAMGNNGERSQGHNSIIAAEDGRTYLVYHTRFQNAGEAHQVRVHQVFQNSEGWLVAAPFEYTGETVRSADIANAQQVATSRIAGTYQLLVHRYKLDHTQKERVTPVEIHLNVDGSIDGSVSGRWTIQEGTSYINITLGSVTYRGVVIEQMLEPTTTQTIAFTAMSTATGVSVWGYQTAPSSDIRMITTDALTVDAPVYDLLGRRVSSVDRKGIYFQNGRKLFIK